MKKKRNGFRSYNVIRLYYKYWYNNFSGFVGKK